MNQHNFEHMQSTKLGFLFGVFCVWTFVLLGRPQDIFTFLAPIRPALTLGIVMFLVFILMNRGSSRNSFNNTQVKLYTAFICVMIISVPFAIYRRMAFMFFFTGYISAILFFFIFYKVVDSVKKLETILFIGCLGAGIYSISALIEGHWFQRLWFGRMFDPNDLVFFTLSFLPLNFVFLSKDNPLLKRLVCMSNLVFGVLLILMTGSRGGIVAFGAAILMLLLTKSHTIKLSYKAMIVVLCLAALYYASARIGLERYEGFADIREDYNVTDETGRLHVWERALKIMLRHPFTGVGLNCFMEAIGTDRKEQGLIPIWQAPHNSLIQIGTETGIIGLILFALMSFKAFRIFGQVKAKTHPEKLVKISEMARVGFVGHFTAGMFLSGAYSVYWALYIVLSAILSHLIAIPEDIDKKHSASNT